jgi:hypothetical protein
MTTTEPAVVTALDPHHSDQPFRGNNEVFAQVGWVDTDTHNIYSLDVPADHTHRIGRLNALYISLGSHHHNLDAA